MDSDLFSPCAYHVYCQVLSCNVPPPTWEDLARPPPEVTVINWHCCLTRTPSPMDAMQTFQFNSQN